MAAEQGSGTILSDPTGGNAILGLQRWRVLSQSDNYSFDDYAGFLMTYPGWPEEARMRRTAEQAINIASFSADRVITFFDRFEPLTNTGAANYALALQSKGQTLKADAMAKQAWRGGALTKEVETMLLRQFTSALTIEDHDARMDALLWARALPAAMGQLGFTSPARRPVFEARLAQLTEAPDANAKANAVASRVRGDAGFIADRSRYLRNKGQSFAARQIMASRPVLNVRPESPAQIATWYEANLINARAAANDRQWTVAYDIASKVDDAYAGPTNIAEETSSIRDKYSDLVWLAGNAALWGQRQPAKAVAMFDRYARSYNSPNIRSKGYYWAGRAAAEAGQTADAKAYFENAAAFPGYFYGQLALERLGRPLPKFDRKPDIEITDQDRRAYDQRPLVIAAKASIKTGPWREQIRFHRALAENAKTPKDYMLLSDLAQRTGARDLGVIKGISALGTEVGPIDETSFPIMPVPAGQESNWTMIHAITRQESQFAEGAISHAGARGLMQLMPATAREQSGKIGLSYNQSALITDPQYNVRLGSTYFQRILNYYNGSYPLAIAAYNGGFGNVNKWLQTIGDPRKGEIDWLKWIEDLPFSETSNYVRRVLENAVVYDTMNPRGARFKDDAPLTRYIGKNYKG